MVLSSLSFSPLVGSAKMTNSKDDFAEYPKRVRSRTQEPHTTFELVEERKSGGGVYTTQPGGSHATPTGRIFIRFADGLDVADRAAEIEAAGYKIAETLAYATNAAWLTERSGSIGRALAGIKKLESIRDVENVEPQMLTKREAK